MLKGEGDPSCGDGKSYPLDGEPLLHSSLCSNEVEILMICPCNIHIQLVQQTLLLCIPSPSLEHDILLPFVMHADNTPHLPRTRLSLCNSCGSKRLVALSSHTGRMVVVWIEYAHVSLTTKCCRVWTY